MALYVVTTCHEGTAVCVRNATPEEEIEEIEKQEGWAMPLEIARDLASEAAKESGQRWYDFSEEP